MVSQTNNDTNRGRGREIEEEMMRKKTLTSKKL